METVRVAVAQIRVNVLRSFLTMLGIVIGVAAVITMVGLGSGAQRAVEEQLRQLGTDLLSIRPNASAVAVALVLRVQSVQRSPPTMPTHSAIRACSRPSYRNSKGTAKSNSATPTPTSTSWQRQPTTPT